MKRVRFIGVAAAVLLACTGIQVGAADANFAEGQKLMTARNYGGAAAKFEAAMRANPRDPNMAYYCALANQYANQRTRAKQLYEYISSAFPGTQVAAMASRALAQLGTVTTPSSSGSTGGSGSVVSHSSGGGNNGIAPAHSFSVPYDHSGGPGVYLMGSINGQPMKFHFDTGAAGTVIGKNHLEEIGYARAAAGGHGLAGGVGDEGPQKTWKQPVLLRIGEAQIRDFPLTVMDHMDGQPLLGQDFLRNFEYAVDPTKNVVTFKVRREGDSSSGTATASRPQRRGTIDIPFRDGGQGHIIVQCRVNGKPYDFYFDTGADGVALSTKDLKPLGLEIPAGARETMSRGVAGSTRTWIFTVDSIKLGTIEKENQQVGVVESSTMDHPLLGQSFFGDYQTNIDAAAHVIHFYKGD